MKIEKRIMVIDFLQTFDSFGTKFTKKKPFRFEKAFCNAQKFLVYGVEARKILICHSSFIAVWIFILDHLIS